MMQSKGEIIFRNFKNVCNSADPLVKNIRYILNPKKTQRKYCLFIGTDDDTWEQDGHIILKRFSYEGIRAVSHCVISAKGKMDPLLMIKAVEELIKQRKIVGILAVAAVHINGANTHVHIVRCNVDAISGAVYQASPKDLFEEREHVNTIFSSIGYPLRGFGHKSESSKLILRKEVFKNPVKDEGDQVFMKKAFTIPYRSEQETDYDGSTCTMDPGPGEVDALPLLRRFLPLEKIQPVRMKKDDEKIEGLPVPEKLNELTPEDAKQIVTVIRGTTMIAKMQDGSYGTGGKKLLKDIMSKVNSTK
jgi:hypothetical protein